MIQLTKDLAMSADDNCYMVGKPCQESSKGGPYTRLASPTYHTTAAQAVSAAVNRTMRKGVADGSITTLRQFIQEQERLQAELAELVAPLDTGQSGARPGT